MAPVVTNKEIERFLLDSCNRKVFLSQDVRIKVIFTVFMAIGTGAFASGSALLVVAGVGIIPLSPVFLTACTLGAAIGLSLILGDGFIRRTYL